MLVRYNMFKVCVFGRVQHVQGVCLLVRYNKFKGCPQAKTCTLILRGGSEQFMEETERSLHDAIMIVRRAIKNDAVVAGKLIFLKTRSLSLYIIITV